MQSALSPVMYLEASLQVLFVLSRRSALQGNWKGKVRLELGVMLHELTPEIVDHQRRLHSLPESLHLLRCKIADEEQHLQHPSLGLLRHAKIEPGSF